MNRDYFSSPIQGNGRGHHGYGHTKIHHDKSDAWARPVAIAVAVIAAYFIWQFSR